MDQQKFDSSESRLRELVHRRHVLEKKAQLRTATLSEFAVVHDNSLRAIRNNAQEQFKHACSRNEQMLKDMASSTVSSYEQLREHSDTKSSAAARLREQKRRYNKSVATNQPLWKAQEMHLEEQKLHMIRKEQQEAQQRRQNWMVEEARAETLKKSLDHERRELMIQLALEEKDKIAADMRHAQAERSRVEVEQVLVRELTSFHSTTQEESARLAQEDEVSNQQYIQRTMTLQSNQGLPLAYNDPAVGLSDVAPLQRHAQKQFQMNRQGVSTSGNPRLTAGAAHSNPPVANAHSNPPVANALRARMFPDSSRGGGILNELGVAVDGSGEVNLMNVSADSEPSEQLQEPLPSAVEKTPKSSLPRRPNAEESWEDKENSSSSRSNDNAPVSKVASSAPAASSLRVPVQAHAPDQQSQQSAQVPTISPSSSSGALSLSVSASMHRSPSMIHQADSSDVDGMGMHSPTRSPDPTAADDFSLSVPYSPSHATPSPSKSSKSPKFNFNETEASSINADQTQAADISLTPMPHPGPKARPFQDPLPGLVLVPPTPPAHVDEPSVFVQEEPPVVIARHTDSWKLIQCAMSLKQLYSRFEELRNDTSSRSPEVATEADTKKLYTRCIKVIAGHSTDSNSSLAGEYSQSHVSVGRALSAALHKREKELVIFGPEVLVMGFLEIVQERAFDIMPLELFNGIVTLDKLQKFYKAGGLGAEETFNAIIQHMRQQVDKRVFSVDESVSLYTELFLSELLRDNEQDRGRVTRKLSQLLKEAVLNCLASGGGTSFAASPVKPSSTPAGVKTATTTTPGANAAHQAANSSKKNNASKFVSLDDDEFIVDDSPPQKPPAMKDLSVFVETPAKPQEQSSGKGQGQGQGKGRRDAPPPPAVIEEEEEFDFL